MLGTLVVTVLATAFPALRGDEAWWALRPPLLWLSLAAHAVFYTVALVGPLLPLPGLLGKLTYLPTFLASSNAAVFLSFFRFLFGRQTVLWQRVERPSGY